MKSLMDKIVPYRELWERDPSVTFKSIAEEVGCSSPTVATAAKRGKWMASEAVLAMRRKLNCSPRKAVPKDGLALVLIQPEANTAWPSIWAAASGSAVKTSRPHGEQAC